ncbi:hypothetical protein I5I57_19470 [Pseudomonas aeruginosa]|nr:hypothetical protein [Pseudomonas aeruginosa]
MSKSLIVSLAASLVVLAGCANPPRSVERPYSDAEIKSYALDSLERSDLSPKRLAQYRSVRGTPHRQTLSRLQTGRRQTLASQGCCSRGRPGGR